MRIEQPAYRFTLCLTGRKRLQSGVHIRQPDQVVKRDCYSPSRLSAFARPRTYSTGRFPFSSTGVAPRAREVVRNDKSAFVHRFLSDDAISRIERHALTKQRHVRNTLGWISSVLLKITGPNLLAHKFSVSPLIIKQFGRLFWVLLVQSVHAPLKFDRSEV